MILYFESGGTLLLSRLKSQARSLEPAVIKKKDEPLSKLVLLYCGRKELNLHALNGHKDLNLTRLPIPPRPRWGRSRNPLVHSTKA